MKHALLSMLFALAFLANIHAQKGKAFFQTFDVEGMNAVKISISDEFTVEKWVNRSAILIETSVSLTNVSDKVYNFHMNSGRYDLTELDDEGTQLIIGAKHPVRSIVDGVESVKVTIFIPEDFEMINENTFVRKTQTEDAVTSKDQQD